MAVGILQHLGFAALSRAGRRHHGGGALPLCEAAEHLCHVGGLPQGVAHAKLSEEPSLQAVAHLPALSSQLSHSVLQSVHSTQSLLHTFAAGHLKTVQLGILELSSAHIVIVGLSVEPCAGVCRLEGLHGLLRSGLLFFQTPVCDGEGFAALQVGYAVVQGRDGGLVSFEVALGLQVVKHGRHKARPVAPAAHLSAVARQVAQPAVTFHHKHA